MKFKTKIFGVLISIMLGIIYSPFIIIGMTDFLGISKGSNYTIAEPELTAYRQFGIGLLFFLILFFIIIEFIFKKTIYKDANKYFIINIFITFIVIIILCPYLAR